MQIAARFPDDRVYGEEFGPDGPGGSAATAGSAATDGAVSEQLTVPAGRVWHLDPIDGTLNFALGLPNFCTSIALMDGEEILAASTARRST